MASEEQITQLRAVDAAIEKVDEEKLLRPSLGEEALKEEFAVKLAEIRRRAAVALEHAPEVHHSQMQGIIGSLQHIQAELEQQAERSNAEYVTQRPQFLTNIDNRLEELKQHWPALVAAAIEARGLLEDEGLKREYERTIKSIREESENTIRQVQEEANKTIEEAKTLADQIESRARLTASGISVDEAQKQFREAQTGLDRGVRNWTWWAIGGILAFIGAAVYFMKVDLPDEWQWQVVYQSAIRVTILAAVGTAAAFCLRMLRAHLHMSEKNRHRQRIANSIAAFVDSAGTAEQRDMILSQLVDSVVQFGNSGLITREDNVYRSKAVTDSLVRAMFTSSTKQ